MTDSDDVDGNIAVGLCIDCAKHPSLKKVISEDCEPGLCAFCGRTDAPIRAPDRAQPMVMLLRALIRFYWDEWSYNPHWGGESALSLLSEPGNPVVEPPTTDEFSDEFTFLLEEPPYPAWEEGIAIYAGHDEDGMRGLNTAISRARPLALNELRSRLLLENFTDVDADLEAIVEPFLEDITCILPQGELWHRARLGHKRLIKKATLEWEGRVFREPWTKSEIGAPPPPMASTGRLNRSGVAMLYLTSNPETAIAEIRPHPGHTISVGAFRNNDAVRIADFDPDIAVFSSSDARLALFEIVHAFDRSMSTPVTPDKQTPYLLTQLLAEVLRRRGFDGVRFRSSVSDGENLCIFRPAKFAFVEGHSKVCRLQSVRYESIDLPTILEPKPDDQPIADES